MKWNKNKSLNLSIVILIMTLIVTGLAILQPWNREKAKSNYFGKSINSFCINQICLDNNNGDWSVSFDGQKAPAKSEIVDTYVAKFRQINLQEIVSVNPERFLDMGIGESKVTLSINGKILEIGRIDSNYDGTYVREENGNTVYDIPVVLDKENLTNIDQWLNKTLTNLAILQTKKITAEKQGSKVQEIKPTDKILHLEAVSFLNGFTPSDEPKYTFNIETETDRAQLVVGNDNKDRKNPIFWATNDMKNYYSISKEDFILLTGKIN